MAIKQTINIDKLESSWKVSKQADPNHVGSGQIRLTRNGKFQYNISREEDPRCQKKKNL